MNLQFVFTAHHYAARPLTSRRKLSCHESRFYEATRADGRLLKSALQSKIAVAFVVAGTGLGSVSTAMFDAVRDARGRNIPALIRTRVPTGRVFPLSATKGQH